MTTSDRIAIVNARIWTGNPRRPWAECILMHDAVVELVGSSAEVRKRIMAPTPTIDARGRLVMPGWAGAASLRGEEELVAALHARCRGASVDDLNVLLAGAPANAVMLDRDITRAGSGDAGRAQLLLVIEAGRVVINREGLA